VLNDINGELCNLYRVVQHHLDELVRHFRWALNSRQAWDWHQATDPSTLTDIQRAARFYYLQKSAFGGKVTGQTFGTSATAVARINLTRIEEDLSAAHLRLARVTVENLPWQEAIRRYDRPETFMIADLVMPSRSARSSCDSAALVRACRKRSPNAVVAFMCQGYSVGTLGVYAKGRLSAYVGIPCAYGSEPIREARQAGRLSQRGLAQSLGITKATVSQ
jgi:hypothetical protein